jgi:hypothetical protein
MKRIIKHFGIVIIGLLATVQLMAQQRTLSGVVRDAGGEVVIGASVVVKGGSQGTITDINGKYTLQVPAQARTLQVTYVGMKPQEVQITGSVLNITLEEDTKVLEDVVVIGYGTVRKADLT